MRKNVLEIPKLNRKIVFHVGHNDEAAKCAINYLNVKINEIPIKSHEEFYENLKLNPKTEILSFSRNILAEEKIDSIINSLSDLKELNLDNCNITNPTNTTWTLNKLTSLTLNSVTIDFDSKVILHLKFKKNSN